MAKFVLALLAAMAMVLIALGAWRWTDKKADQAVRAGLASHQPPAPAVFDPAMVSALPAPAQRFFRFAIAPGTPLYTVAEISMQGEFSLGSKAEPNYMPMQAEQILAAPYGFIWKVRAGDAVWFTGSDGANDEISWSRFWLFGIVPVARAGNNEDHAPSVVMSPRQYFGRQPRYLAAMKRLIASAESPTLETRPIRFRRRQFEVGTTRSMAPGIQA